MPYPVVALTNKVKQRPGKKLRTRMVVYKFRLSFDFTNTTSRARFI